MTSMCGPGMCAGVDLALEVEVGVGLDGAGGAQGGDARAEVEVRRGEGHLRDHQRRLGVAGGVEVGAGDVVHVVVHADEAGEDGAAGEVEWMASCGKWPVEGAADAGDLAVCDGDGLVFERVRRRCRR